MSVEENGDHNYISDSVTNGLLMWSAKVPISWAAASPPQPQKHWSLFQGSESKRFTDADYLERVSIKLLSIVKKI